MKFAQFLLVLRARRMVFASVLCATVLAAVAASVLLPKTYQATVSLLVDARDEQSLSSALRPLVLPQERLAYLQTQADILRSVTVARKVLRELQRAGSSAAHAAFEDDMEDMTLPEAQVIGRLLKRLKVQTSQSNIIRVSFAAGEPNYAAFAANAFAKAYIDTLLALRVQPTREAAAWFDEQLRTLRTNLESAQQKLTSYQRTHKIISTDGHFDVDGARLQALSEQLVQAQEQMFQSDRREQQAHDFTERGQPLDQLPEVLDNPLIGRLEGDLARGEAALQELSTQYGSNYPLYRRQASANLSLRRRLEVEVRKVVAEIESKARENRDRAAELARTIAAQREHLLDLKENRSELTVLQRNVESAERTYDTAMQHFVTNEVDSRANQTNVTVLSSAMVPRMPSSPRLLLNAAVSLVVGSILAVSMVILMEISDRRVRSRSDLDNAWDVPLLAVLQRPWPGRVQFGRLSYSPGPALLGSS